MDEEPKPPLGLPPYTSVWGRVTSSAKRLWGTSLTGWLIFVAGLLLIGGLLTWFAIAVSAAWSVQTSDRTVCGFNMGQGGRGSYVEFRIEDQAPSEPFFYGKVFIVLVGVMPGLSKVEILTEPAGRSRGYAGEMTDAEFIELPDHSFIMKKLEDVTFTRETGSHRDFPFDSATVVFDLSFDPKIQFEALRLRNYNSSFYIPCETVSVERIGGDKLRIGFELRRNPLVRVTAIVLLIAAFLFVLVTPFAVKWDGLPISVASFFFSIWSIRSILSPEMKVFPTLLDLLILLMSVLLILLIGVRAILEVTKRKKLSAL